MKFKVGDWVRLKRNCEAYKTSNNSDTYKEGEVVQIVATDGNLAILPYDHPIPVDPRIWPSCVDFNDLEFAVSYYFNKELEELINEPAEDSKVRSED